MVEVWTEVTEQTEAWVSETRVGSGAFAAGQFDADAFDVATIWDPWVAAGADIELWTAAVAQ